MHYHKQCRLAFGITSLFVVVILSTNALAQELQGDATGTWFELVGDNTLSERWSIPVVGVLRQYDLGRETEFAFLRTGATYTFANIGLKATMGMAYLDNLPFEQEPLRQGQYQFWVYEELTVLNSAKWSQRFRFEHRWIHSMEGIQTNHRFRYRLQFQSNFAENYYFKCFNEPFFNFREANIDQNRFFIGLGRRLVSNISFEIGYMKDHVKKDNHDRIRMALFFKTRLFKKSEDLVDGNTQLSISQ